MSTENALSAHGAVSYGVQMVPTIPTLPVNPDPLRPFFPPVWNPDDWLEQMRRAAERREAEERPGTPGKAEPAKVRKPQPEVDLRCPEVSAPVREAGAPLDCAADQGAPQGSDLCTGHHGPGCKA